MITIFRLSILNQHRFFSPSRTIGSAHHTSSVFFHISRKKNNEKTEHKIPFRWNQARPLNLQNIILDPYSRLVAELWTLIQGRTLVWVTEGLLQNHKKVNPTWQRQKERIKAFTTVAEVACLFKGWNIVSLRRRWHELVSRKRLPDLNLGLNWGERQVATWSVSRFVRFVNRLHSSTS